MGKIIFPVQYILLHHFFHSHFASLSYPRAESCSLMKWLLTFEELPQTGTRRAVVSWDDCFTCLSAKVVTMSLIKNVVWQHY